MTAAACDWTPAPRGWTLRLAGRWVAQGPWPRVQPPASPQGGGVEIEVDGTSLEAWDAAGAALLWQLLEPLRRAGATLRWTGVPEGLQASLDLALPGPGHMSVIGETDPAPGPVQRAWQGALRTATFFGEVTLALGRAVGLVRGRSDLRLADLLRQVDVTGPLSLPIVSLTSALVGLMLSYMGGAQLDRMGAQGYIADLVSVGMVRELAGMMTGVILAGRIGAGFAAQLASMQAGEEIDALRALGVDPVSHLVLPRLLALVLVAPLLIAWAALLGVLAGLPAAVWVYGVAAPEYLHRALAAMTWTHLWIGLFKGTLYAALVALAGCLEGLMAGRNAQAVGEATTRAVVRGLVWIVAAACGTTIVFQTLGF
ncbi:MAG: ABC transporter permease [Rubrivivax sp.]|jgi:phospholipid/cholesterol/gamma-HCH transport system permease protein|nr:ABC transporter permease [Rubrivivax sp.]